MNPTYPTPRPSLMNSFESIVFYFVSSYFLSDIWNNFGSNFVCELPNFQLNFAKIEPLTDNLSTKSWVACCSFVIMSEGRYFVPTKMTFFKIPFWSLSLYLQQLNHSPNSKCHFIASNLLLCDNLSLNFIEETSFALLVWLIAAGSKLFCGY